MREFFVVLIFLSGLVFALFAGSVIQDAATYRDKWYEPKDFERGFCVLIECERRQQ